MGYSDLFRKKTEFSNEQISSPENNGHSLARHLGVRDLTAFGIAAIIGAGIFSSIGSACYSGGPAVIILFIICAIACGFTAMCYAEFASRVPISGSAYTYAYVTFGELFAWIIGWALLMEYSIGNIYVAFSWSGYFNSLLEGMGVHIPHWLSINYLDAKNAFIKNTTHAETLAWSSAPEIAGIKIIFDMPAVMINILITWLVYVGIKESRNISNIMVGIKLGVIALVIIIGAFYIDIDNWTPFMPNGFGGVMSGIAAVFFAYIGFDAISTLAEESKDPQRDLPKGMIYSLLICTGIFIILALVLTGITSYTNLNVTDPLAEIFAMKGIKWMLFIVSISAVVAMTSVILVFQMGQPRIWMTMSRDGLLPKKFSSIHPKYKTPGFSTIVTGMVVGIPIFFTNKDFVLDFTSIGTLFAFTLVCGGVLMLPKNTDTNTNNKKFKLPYINAKWIIPSVVLFTFITIGLIAPNYFLTLFDFKTTNMATSIPMIIFLIACIIMSVLSFIKNLSLIPVCGLLSCLYLFTGFAPSNWKWFFLWFLIGLFVYFSYGYRKSKLNKQPA